MNKPVTTIIDKNLCTGCGLCVRVCPSDTISLMNKKAEITGDTSLNCGHCEAVCPENAVRVEGNDPHQLEFFNFTQPQTWIKFGDYDVSSLVHLMRSRRSCRNYKNKEVDITLLQDLVKAGTCAPSGTNCQLWTFTILPDRDSVLKFGEKILGFFKKLNSMSEKKWLRKFLKIAKKPQLEDYYNNYYQRVKDKIDEFEASGADSLFHGAASAILVGSKPGASCPAEDALLATQNILLTAHAMGLGTCLIGFGTEALKNDPSIKKYINVPENEKIYSVIAVGYPDEKYMKCCERKKIEPSVVRL